jgi:cell filamentation protein
MDPYLYPGTDVLKNLRDIRNPGILDRFEAEATARRIVELIHSPAQGRFDTAHLRAIHQHVFQDVYLWAGQFRTVNISKDGHLFGAAGFIEGALRDVFQKLFQESYLRELDGKAFSHRVGFYLGEINSAHPFRERNGRAQREFIRGRSGRIRNRLESYHAR